MASASSRSTVADHTLPAGKLQSPVRVLAPPGLLRCLVLSWSEQRTKHLREAAEREAWDVIACNGVKSFLQSIFRQKVPLTVVDLPAAKVENYAELQAASAKVREVSESLLVICGAEQNEAEEIWARQLGVWAYVANAERPAELDWMFSEARKALVRQATARVDSPAVRVTTEAHLRLDETT